MLKIRFVQKNTAAADTAIVGILPGGTLTDSAAALDDALIRAAIKRAHGFSGKSGEILSITPPEKSKYARYVLLGLGDLDKITPASAEDLGGKLAAALLGCGAVKAVLMWDDITGKKDSLPPATLAAHIATGAQLRCYEFGKYKETPKDKKPALDSLDIITSAHSAAAKAHKHGAAVVAGTHAARDLMNEPPNILYPDSFAKRVSADLKKLGVTVEIIDEKKMKTLGMGSALAVGQGSARPPCMVVMRWMGASGTGKADTGKSGVAAGKKAGKKSAPLAFIGKGVTFDTGGISIKPAAGMDEMKMDMGGAAAVVGLITALATRKAKVDVVGIIALAENMPSDRSYRPGDIVKSMAGKTIEVLNTDAEGRLVLIDAMTYIQRTYKPRLMVDLATLTGAIMVALGTEYAGAFVNDDKLWQELDSASAATGEKIWRMPLDEAYRKTMDSRIADLNNLGDASRYGGACNAAGFLERFVENDCPWAHLDIAGMMISRADKPIGPRGPLGFGVRLLDRFVADHYE